MELSEKTWGSRLDVKGGLDTLIKNGKVSIDDIKANPNVFNEKSIEEIADVLRKSGYDVTIKTSTRSRSGVKFHLGEDVMAIIHMLRLAQMIREKLKLLMGLKVHI